MVLSARACVREREAIRGIVDARRSFVPIPILIGLVNRHLRGVSWYDHVHNKPGLEQL